MLEKFQLTMQYERDAIIKDTRAGIYSSDLRLLATINDADKLLANKATEFFRLRRYINREEINEVL